MSELAFHDPRNRRFRSSYGGGTGGGGGGGGGGSDANPDSVVYAFESRVSLFSSSASASASVERCSSSSDVIDHDSLVSDGSLHSSSEGFRGCCSERSSYPDPDTKRNFTVHHNGGPYMLGKKGDKAEAIIEYIDAEADGEGQTLYSARSSFSYKDGQNRKSRSEILLRKSDRRRPASLDLNNHAMNVTSSSPRLGSAMKASASARRRCMFPSPGTPNYHPASSGVQRGWSSERVPLHTNSNRKTLPSKWEDAERWIISPVAGGNGLNPPVQQPKRPKSKSGPLGPHGSACTSMNSPAAPNSGETSANSFVSESLALTAVNVGYTSLVQYQKGRESYGNFSSVMDHCIGRSVSLHGCSELVGYPQDDKFGGLIDASTDISRDVSRRDMATQMSPEGSPGSSPRKPISSSIQTVDLQQIRSFKSDLKDVQMDDHVTLTPSTKKCRGRIPGRESNMVDDWEIEGSEIRTSLSKVKREEAKITAWENLQKAKADAAIRKLEMKLEKKRSLSMDRIVHKLQAAQKKAQEMRESILSSQPRNVAKSSHKTISLLTTRHVRSLTGCFTCPAF